MDVDTIEADRVPERLTEEAAGELHAGAVAIGAAAGVVVAAFIMGSMVLVMILLFGAVAGGLVAAIGALGADKVRGKRDDESDDANESASVDTSAH